jgi:hypothetical protein
LGRFGSDERDLGLRRVSRVTKWLVAASVAAMGAVTAVVADAAPGSSGTNPPAADNSGTGNPPATAAPTTTLPLVDPGTRATPAAPDPPGDQNPTPAPTEPPVPVHRSHHVVSGGS